MSTNQKSTTSEKKDAVVPTSGSEAAPSNTSFMGACERIGFLPLHEPSPADETKPQESDIFDQAGGLKNCPGAFPQPEEEGHNEGHKEDDDDIFDVNGGLKNCPGAFPVDEAEDSDKAPEKREQVQRRELDKYKEKQE